MVMRTGASAAAFAIATFSLGLATADVPDVWCRWNASCVLQASFTRGDEVVIHWKQGEVYVHSYVINADNLGNQHERFTGRTSLFKEKIAEGNASLLLKDVLVGDEGEYMCYVGTLTTATKSFINLRVEAPVKAVHFHPDDEQLMCSSEGIFPEPELHWATEPPLPNALRNASQLQQDAQTGLYGIKGSLALAAAADRDVEYVCEVRSFNSSGRVTWRNTNVNISDTETSIDCETVTNQSSLEWTFNRSRVIASKRAGHQLEVADDWRKHVLDVSAAGTLYLQELNSSLDGTYTCTLSNATQTRIKDVSLRVICTGLGGRRIGLIVAGVLVVVLALVFLVVCLTKTKRSENQRGPRAGTPETIPLQ